MSEAASTSGAARSASSTRSTTSACCSSPATASRPSTSSCRPRSRTRAACSPASPASGSRGRRHIVPNHLLALRDDGRSTECRRLEMLPIECVVRGYLAGSGWKDYQRDAARSAGTGCPQGLQRVRAAARADLHAGDEGADRPRREHHARARPPSSSARERFAEVGADLRSRCTASAPSYAADARDHPRRHEVRVRRSTTTDRLVLGDEALTPDSSRFWPADEYEPGRPQPSFDKQFVRDYCETLGWDKTASGPGAAGRRRRRHARALRRGVRAADRHPVRRATSPTRRSCCGEGDRPRPARRQGILDPQGEAVEQSLAQARLRRSARPASAASSTSRSRRPTGARRAPRSTRCATQLLANPLIEAYEIELHARADSRTRRASITFPGLERRPRRALGARRRSAPRPCPSGTRESELPDVGAVVLPGGFSYGDYLRCGAIARFSPAMEAVARVRRRRRARCSGSATASRSSARPGCSPACCAPNASLSFVCRDVAVRVERTDTAFTSRCARGQRLVDPGQARRGLLVRATPELARGARGERPDRAPLRRRQPERLASPTSPA